MIPYKPTLHVWVRNDALGPGQRFAIAAMEVCERVPSWGNEVTIRWVSAHSKVAGNEQADAYAKVAARRAAPHNEDDDMPEGLLTEASLSQMFHSATEARSRAAAEWVASHVLPQRPTAVQAPAGEGPPPAPTQHQERAGREVLSVPLRPWVIRVVPQEKEGRFGQVLVLQHRREQSQFHLVARCPAWAGQARAMWKRIGRLCEKRGPVTPSVRAMFGDQRATPEVLTFLRDTRVGKMISLAPRGENLWEEEEGSSESEGEEGGPGPP